MLTCEGNSEFVNSNPCRLSFEEAEQEPPMIAALMPDKYRRLESGSDQMRF